VKQNPCTETDLTAFIFQAVATYHMGRRMLISEFISNCLLGNVPYVWLININKHNQNKIKKGITVKLKQTNKQSKQNTRTIMQHLPQAMPQNNTIHTITGDVTDTTSKVTE